MKGELAKPNNIVSSGVVIQACAALGNSLWFLCLGFWYLQKVVKMLISFIRFGTQAKSLPFQWLFGGTESQTLTGSFKSHTFCVCNQSQQIVR